MLNGSKPAEQWDLASHLPFSHITHLTLREHTQVGPKPDVRSGIRPLGDL